MTIARGSDKIFAKAGNALRRRVKDSMDLNDKRAKTHIRDAAKKFKSKHTSQLLAALQLHHVHDGKLRAELAVQIPYKSPSWFWSEGMVATCESKRASGVQRLIVKWHRCPFALFSRGNDIAAPLFLSSHLLYRPSHLRLASDRKTERLHPESTEVDVDFVAYILLLPLPLLAFQIMQSKPLTCLNLNKRHVPSLPD
jgi:hypothetical protein